MPRYTPEDLKKFLRKLPNKEWIAGGRPDAYLIEEVVHEILQSLDAALERDPRFFLYKISIINGLDLERVRLENPQIYREVMEFKNSGGYNEFKNAVVGIENAIKLVFHTDRLKDKVMEGHYRDIIGYSVDYFDKVSTRIEDLRFNLNRKLSEIKWYLSTRLRAAA